MTISEKLETLYAHTCCYSEKDLDALIQEARAEAWDEGRMAGNKPISQINPYRP